MAEDDAVLVEHHDANADPPELTNEDDSKKKKEQEASTPKSKMEKAKKLYSSKSNVNVNDDSNKPKPIQIVSIGSEEDSYAFRFHEKKLQRVISKIPEPHKIPVNVISVVGAFRTGKSFVLSWFLRYLTYITTKQEKGEDHTLQTSKPWFEEMDSLGKDGFSWQGGSDRNTTGIWIWSDPFILEKKNGKKIAVLLIDTQGMFDHETTMALTASIFGFSTLLSSYQIYNIDKRIQEDNLQQLALFSEYARMASTTETKDSKEKGKKATTKPIAKETKPTEEATTTTASKKPFQHIEFLVRDWQHYFDEETDDHDEDNPNYEFMEASMMKYLDKVIAERDATDLRDTRQQIVGCFENITCYGLCHPGIAITKKKYDGKISVIEDLFLSLINRYCKRVFDVETMVPKYVHGNTITAMEWVTYMQAYANLFVKGATFPEASTLLDATVTANNMNAVNSAILEYKTSMDSLCGPKCSNYVHPDALQKEARLVRQRSLQKFESMANFGNPVAIEKAKKDFLESIEREYETYESLNDARDPLAGIVTFVLPTVIAFVAMIARWFTDMTCSPYADVCKGASDMLAHTSAIFTFFILIVGITRAQEVRNMMNKMYETSSALYTAASAQQGGGGGATTTTTTTAAKAKKND